MLNSVVSLRLNIVEQLIIFVLNVFNDLLSMVEFNIVWVVLIVMIKFVPISMPFVVSLAMVNGLVNTVVSVEVRVTLNAMLIMIRVVYWMEAVGTRRVVVAASVRSIDVVMRVLEAIAGFVMV